jgi:hypothetical protein
MYNAGQESGRQRQSIPTLSKLLQQAASQSGRHQAAEKITPAATYPPFQ